MLVLLDGPNEDLRGEICARLSTAGAQVRRWGPADPDVPSDLVYGPTLLKDLQNNHFTVWDRAWPSDHVHGAGRLADDPWLGEWIYGRALRAVGIGFLLMDNAGDPRLELRFKDYGQRFNYQMLVPSRASILTEYITAAAEVREALASLWRVKLPFYGGPADALVVVVGDERSKHETTPGGFLPMTSRLCTQLGRDLGDAALRCGWINAAECSPQTLTGRRLLVACGNNAARWIKYHVPGGDHEVVQIDHPAYIYRWKDSRTSRAVHPPGAILPFQQRLAAHREKLAYIRRTVEETTQ